MSAVYNEKKLTELKVIYLKIASLRSDDCYGDALKAVAEHCYAEGFNDGEREGIEKGATEQYWADKEGTIQ
jgi:hypothetical protein